jgi:aminoglycoside phosphotransferase (APT) family kinase protein
VVEGLAERQIAGLDARSLGRVDRTATGLTVCQFSTAGGAKLALKVAGDEISAEGLSREAEYLRGLRAHSGLPRQIVNSLPHVLESSRHQGYAYRLETWLPGRSASDLMYWLGTREEMIDTAIDWITALHKSSVGAARQTAGYAEWARAVILRISARAGSEDEAFAERIAAYLTSRLDRYSPPTVSGHGDYWLGNILRDPDSGRITGVIDWQHGDRQAPPLEDVLHMLFTRKWLFSFYDPGSHVAAFLKRRHGPRDRQRIAGYMKDLGLSMEAVGLLTVLYWIRYLAEWEASEGPKRGWYHRSYSRVRNVLSDELETRLDGLGSWLSAT